MKVRLEIKDLPIKLRPLKASDYIFIKDTWLKTLHGQEPFKHIPTPIFRREYEDILEEQIAEGFTQVLCHAEIEDEIISYFNYRRKKDMILLNFMYTKKPYRKLGLARYLLERVIDQIPEETPIFYTTHTVGSFWLRDKRMIYNPFLLWWNL